MIIVSIVDIINSNTKWTVLFRPKINNQIPRSEACLFEYIALCYILRIPSYIRFNALWQTSFGTEFGKKNMPFPVSCMKIWLFRMFVLYFVYWWCCHSIYSMHMDNWSFALVKPMFGLESPFFPYKTELYYLETIAITTKKIRNRSKIMDVRNTFLKNISKRAIVGPVRTYVVKYQGYLGPSKFCTSILCCL